LFVRKDWRQNFGFGKMRSAFWTRNEMTQPRRGCYNAGTVTVNPSLPAKYKTWEFYISKFFDAIRLEHWALRKPPHTIVGYWCFPSEFPALPIWQSLQHNMR